MLQGLLPNVDLSSEELEDVLLEGKVCEIRMLFYVGKDLLRWIEQCLDSIDREPANTGIELQSFALFLVNHAPAPVREKLSLWGVQDFRSIFRRAIGLNAIFADAPDRDLLSEEFIRNYHRYSDQMFVTWRDAKLFHEIEAGAYHFDLYASAEYSRLLERQWTEAD